MNEVIAKLKKYYELTTNSEISPVAYLSFLNNYINFIKSEEIFDKIYLSMKEDDAKESIERIQESIHDKNAKDIYEYQLQEGLIEGYPIFEYEQLIEFPEEYSFIKDLKTEEEINKIIIVIETETSNGKGSKHTSGASILTMVKLNAYNKQLKPLHEYLIKKLDWINKHGVFSQYLDFNNETGILYFNGKEIPMNIKKSISNANHLLNYLFNNNPFEQHYCDELDEGKALLEESKHWKSYYDASADIQNKVQKITGVNDFLDFNSGKGMYVRLNPKYSLSKLI